MPSELELALAQVFLKKGKSKLTEKEFVFAASLDLRWFSPKQAQMLLEIGLESDLLKRDGDMVMPTFDHKDMTVKPGYAPTADILKTTVKPKGEFMKVIDEIVTKSGMAKTDVISEINGVQDQMNVDIEVAALIVARTHGLDVSKHLDTVEESVASRYKNK